MNITNIASTNVIFVSVSYGSYNLFVYLSHSSFNHLTLRAEAVSLCRKMTLLKTLLEKSDTVSLIQYLLIKFN
jgi:hypothetical protein